MKRIFNIIVVSMALILFGIYNVYANDNIDLSKEVITDGWVKIEAFYNDGREGADVDSFTKKSWIRTELLEEDADLREIYLQNKAAETIMEFDCYRECFYLTATQNGTYIFCGWVDELANSDLEPENPEAPSYIERIDVTEIKDYPSADPAKLEYLTFDAETGTITGCDTVVSGELVIPAEINGATVTAIGNNAFYQCGNLTDVTVPSSVKTIGNQAFYECGKLNNIDVWYGAESIGEGAFSGCSALTGIYLPESVNTIGKNAFYCCSNLKNAEIPINLTELGECAFKYCTALTSIYVPSAIEAIPAEAFYGDTSLKRVSIKNSVNKISANAFYGCTGLTEVYLPVYLESIGDTAFAKCEALKEISIPASVTSIGADAFSETSEDFTIYGYSNSYAKTYADENGIKFVDPDAPLSQVPYQITGLFLTDTAGEPIDEAPLNTGFIAETEIKEIIERNEKDYFLVAVYGKDGELLNIDYVKADFIPNGTCSFGFYIPAQSAEIGSVKAFVWSSFTSTEPLAESKSLAF